MPKWYISPVVAYTRDGETTRLPLIASRINHEEIYTDADGVEHSHYYEIPAYTGCGMSFAYDTEPEPSIGGVALIRIEDTYSVRDADGNVSQVDNPIPDPDVASAVTDFLALIAAHPTLASRFVDQPEA